MKLQTFTLLLSFLLIGAACSSQNCRRKDKIPDMPGYENMNNDALEINPKKDPNIKTVKVFKYDGGLQCGMGKAIPLKQMRKDLAGIRVYSQISKSDGLIRIQACGTPTGQANIYEINRVDLAKAKDSGFQIWNY